MCKVLISACAQCVGGTAIRLVRLEQSKQGGRRLEMRAEAGHTTQSHYVLVQRFRSWYITLKDVGSHWRRAAAGHGLSTPGKGSPWLLCREETTAFADGLAVE